MEKNDRPVSVAIRRIRRQHGWSLKRVAKQLAISIPALSKIETGVTDINLSRLQQIANLYSISVAELFSLDTEEIKRPFPFVNKTQQQIRDYKMEIVSLQRKLILMHEKCKCRDEGKSLL